MGSEMCIRDRDYTARAKVSEGLGLLAGAKSAVSIYRQEEGSWPADWAAAGVDTDTGNADAYGADAYVDYIQNAGTGLLRAYFQNVNTDVDGEFIAFQGAETGTGVQWTCSSDIEFKYLPSTCRNAITP